MIHPIRIVDSYLMEHHSINESRVTGRYRPTDASMEIEDGTIAGTCMRLSYYRYKGIEPSDPPSASRLRRMALGNHIEGEELLWMNKCNILVDQHVPIEFPHPWDDSIILSGEIDCLLRGAMAPDFDPTRDSEIVIGEIKSGAGQGFYKHVLDPKSGRPNDHHLLQGMLYLYMYGRTRDLIFIYIDRGTALRREHHLTLDNGVAVINTHKDNRYTLQKILHRNVLLDEHINHGVLPPRDYAPIYSESDIKRHSKAGTISASARGAWSRGEPVGDWTCRDCTFRSRCLDDTPGKMAQDS
jgi:hypothetical protein